MFVDDPIKTPESASEERIVFPLPADVSVRLPFEVVARVAAAPPPRFNVVESIPRVAAASMVARTPALIVVSPDAERVVSEAAIVNVLSPESRVRVFVVEASVPAPAKVRESISKTVPSTVTDPALALSSIVIDPVEAETSNSVKLIAVAPPLIEVSDVPFSVVVPVRLTVSELSPRIDPAAPLRGDILMFPVVFPPRFRVLLFVVWIEALLESRAIDPEMVAT